MTDYRMVAYVQQDQCGKERTMTMARIRLISGVVMTTIALAGSTAAVAATTILAQPTTATAVRSCVIALNGTHMSASPAATPATWCM